MYNFYTSVKEKQKNQKSEQAKNIQQKNNQRKLQNDKRLIKRYLERTTHGYEKMIEANQDIKEYKNYQHQFRDFNKSLNVGPPSFYYRSRNEKQRINDALNQNKDLDDVPFFSRANPTRHNFRENKAQSNFKFTSYDTTSRVIESVQNMKTNQIPTSWDLNVRDYLKSRHNSSKSKSKQKSPQRSILPILNIKHHPKSIQSIKNKIKLGPLKDAVAENKKEKDGKQNIPRPLKKKDLTVKFSTVHLQSLCREENCF